MDEKYISDLYNQLGGKSVFGEYNDFKSLINTDDNYASDVYNQMGGESVFGKYDDFRSLTKGVSLQPLEKKNEKPTELPLEIGSSASSASPDPEALRFAELVKKQGEVVGKRRDEPGYVDPRKTLGMYPTKEQADRATAQAMADIDASTGMIPEYEEKDFFEGGAKSTLEFFDKYVPVFNTFQLGEAIDDTARTLASGYAQGQLASVANDLLLSGTTPDDETIEKLIEYGKMAKELGPSDAFINYQKKSEEVGGGAWGFFRGVMDNPAVLPELIVNSLTAMATNKEAVIAGAGTVLTNALATAAAAGTPTAGTGAAPGFAAGAVAAIPAAMGIASGILTTGATFSELLQQELGTDEFGNPIEPTKENTKAILEDPEKFNKIRNKSILKGATVGAIDFFAGKLASSVGAKILSKSAAKSATGEATRAAYTRSVGTGSAIESTGGALGEFAGTGIAGEKQNLENILFEAVTEMPMGALSTAQARLAAPVYKVNKKKVTAEQIDEIIDTMEPADLAVAKIEIENDYEGRKKRMQDKIVTGSIANEVRAAQPDLNEPTVNAIVDLQKQLNALEGNKTQVAKDKAAQIRAEIKNLQENQLPEAATVEQKEAVAESGLTPEQRAQEIESIELDLEYDDRMISEGGQSYNAEERTSLEEKLQTLKAEQDAIQEQAAGEVPVQSGTGVGQEVAQGEPQAEPQVTAEAGVQEEVKPQVTATSESFEGFPVSVVSGNVFHRTNADVSQIKENGFVIPTEGRAKLGYGVYSTISGKETSFGKNQVVGDVEGLRMIDLTNDEFGDKINELQNIGSDGKGGIDFNLLTNKLKENQIDGVITDSEFVVFNPSKIQNIREAAAQPQAQPAAAPIAITDILKDIKVSFAPETAVEVQKATREDTRGRKFTYDAAVTAQATDQNGTPIGLITKRSNEDGVLSFTLKNTSGQNINKGKAYPTERDARMALAEQVNRVRAKAAPTPVVAPAPVVVEAAPVVAPAPEPILVDDQAEPILVTAKEIKSNLPKFTRDNAIEYDTDYKEDSMGRDVEYTSLLTVEALDIDGVEIGTITKLIDDEKNATYTAQDIDRVDVGRGKEYDSEAEVIKALTDHINKKRKKEFDKEVAKIVKAREKAAAKVKLAEERKAAKQAAKEKTPEVDAVIEEDANAEGVLERSLDFLENVSKGLDKTLKRNANEFLLAIPLSTLQLAVDAAKVLVRAGIALRDAIAKVAKDYNLAVKDVEEALKIVSEQAEKEAAAAMPMSADNVKYSDSDVLPKPDKKVSNSTVAKLLQEVAANFWGGSIVTSETITPEQERLITINGTEETIRAFEDSDKNAADWYSKAIETAVAVAGVIHPELSSVEAASKIEAFAKEKDPVKAAQMALRMALAITSQNLNVDANTTYAEEQFNYYKKNGKFDPSKKYGAKAPAISSNLKLANLLIDKLGLNGAENFVSQDFTVNQLEEAFQKATGKKVKISGLRNDDVNGAAIFGPKIGQGFLQNLMGKFDPVTIDLWMRRTWGRWTGDVVGTGVTDKRMARLILAVNEAVKNKEIPKSLIPKEFFEYKPIQEKNEGGDLFWTMNDKFNDRIENDLDFLDVLNKFTKELTRQANNLYKAVHDIPMTKELYGKFLSGEMSYFEVANKLMSLDSKLKDNYSKYVANQKSKGLKVLSLNDKKVNDEIVKGYKSTEYARLGNTYSPSNEEISQRKPIWGNAAKNIVVDLNPIDIPSNLDRRVITRVVNNIRKNVNARGYNVTNADVQALLWYPEKDIWAKLRGEEESILKLSYDDQFIKIAKERGLGKQAEAVAEDIRGRRTESDVRKDDRRTDGKVSSRVDELAEIDVKTPSNAEIVINFLDGVDKAIAKVLKRQANEFLLGVPLTIVQGMVKTLKVLVKGGMKLRDAIKQISEENNITQEKFKDLLNISSIQEEFNALMTKADEMIARQKSRGIEDKTIVLNLDKMVRDFYKDMNVNDAQRKIMEREARARMGVEPRKAASIGRVLGVLKDIANVTREEKLKIISRIRELGRDVAKDLAAEIRELAASGKITANQAASIVARTLNINPLNEASVTNFVDYMAKVFSKADYVGKMTTALKQIKQAKKNIKTKIGVAQDLFEPLNQLLSINPTLIPLNQLEKYLGILEDFGARKEVLTVKDRVKVLKQVNEILEEISNEQDLVDVLADRFNNYDKQVFNEEGGLDYAATIKKMIDDGKISTDEADLMKKYKSEILPQVEPAPATDEQIIADKKKEIKTLKSLKIDNDEFPLPSRDEKEDAISLSKLINKLSVEDLMNLSLTELKNIIKVIGNINNGYLPHYAKISIEKLNSIPKGDVLSKAIERAKPLAFSKLYARAKEKLKESKIGSFKKTMDELIRGTPLYYIGDVFGDFKTKDIFNSLLEESAQALSAFNSELKIIDQKIEAAQNKVLASFTQNPDNYLMSKFRMTAYMLQREYESNIGKKGVRPVAEYLKETIKHIRTGNSVFNDADANKLQKILEELDTYTVDGTIDLDKFYDTFNDAEKNAIKVMTEINASLGEKAAYTASVIRGNKVELMENYFHHNVLHEQNPMDATAAPEFSSEYSNSMRPSTKAKSLIERTDSLTPLNFDLFTSTQRGAKFVLLDYNMTSPIRTSRRTLLQAKKNLESKGMMTNEKLQIFNAINNAYEEALENLLTNNIVQDPLANEVVDFIQKQGYRAALAGTVRFKAELASNIANALIINPKGFAKGIMHAKLIASANGYEFMKNAKSKQTSRLYASDALSGKMVDPQILKQTSGIKGSVSRSAVMNRTLQIYNLTLKKYIKNPVEFIADTMTTTPDKIVSMPLWFGSFMNEFKRITGEEVNQEMMINNNLDYMQEYADAIEQATRKADQESVYSGAANNEFMGILKGKLKPNQGLTQKIWNNFNSYMTNFMNFDYAAARSAVYNLFNEGYMTKKKAAAVLAGITTRSVIYQVMVANMGAGIVGAAFGLAFDWEDEEEVDEKSFFQKLGRGLANVLVGYTVGRNFGNAVRGAVNFGVEKINEEYLDFLRNGEYDFYRDNIAYTYLNVGDRGDIDVAKMAVNMAGPYSPALNTAVLIGKNFGSLTSKVMGEGPTKKEPEAIRREEMTVNYRIPLEVAGNAGFIPFYKDVKKAVNDEIYKDLRKAANTPDSSITSSDEYEKLKDLRELKSKTRNAEELKVINRKILEITGSDEAKESIEKQREALTEKKKRLLYDSSKGQRYDNESDMKRMNPSLWRKRFGPNSNWDKDTRAMDAVDTKLGKIETKREDKEFKQKNRR